jgi:hypothetical protein
MEYYGEFPHPILHLGVRSIALLTLSPLALAGTFDLHVLAMPPAFNLSHDQTLQLISLIAAEAALISREARTMLLAVGPFGLSSERSPTTPHYALGGRAWRASPPPRLGTGRKIGFTRSPHNGWVEYPL